MDPVSQGTSAPSRLAPGPFVVGVPGSGTTLLRRQLKAHPELAEVERDDAADIGALSHANPKARFIHVIRDGRDVAASRLDTPSAPGDGGIAAIAVDWRDTVWQARRAGARLPHYTEVRYEDLARDPGRVLRDLCDFLEVDFAPEMVRADEPADGVGRWRHALSDHEVTRFERFAGAALALAGYQPYERPFARAAGGREVPGTTPAMKVVLGRQSLAVLGGTETYAITVARELERLGHDVTLATEEFGVAAAVAGGHGIRIARLDELPSACDAVLAHDLPMAAALAAKYPDARRVFVAHTDRWDLQLPPLVPGLVDAMVACSDRFAARLRALPLKVPIIRLREPIDTDAYSLFPKTLPDRPRRALLLSNYLQGERRRMLVDAWEQAGIECVQAGVPAEVVVDLGPSFASADIVVAKARAALEGMYAGCAVYVYDQYGGDGWVTPDNYPSIEADHFAGQAIPGPRTSADLVADLAAYSPEMGIMNNELVRAHHGSRHHAIELVAIMRGAYARQPDQVDVVAEVARLARISGHAELRSAESWKRMTAAEARAADAERQIAEAEGRVAEAEMRAAEAERELGDARYLLDTKRVRAGLGLGRLADRLRART